MSAGDEHIDEGGAIDLTTDGSIPARLDKQELEEYSLSLANAIGSALPDDVYFALFIYKADGSSKFISDAMDLADVDVIVDRWKEKVFGGPVVGQSATAEIRRLRMYLVNAEISSCKDSPAAIVDAAIARIREIKDRYRQDVPAGRRIL